ncbi:MAG: hypothetical protein LQ341_004182, partial [Variospora aurantia]
MTDEKAIGTPTPPTFGASDGESVEHRADGSVSPRSATDNHFAERTIEYGEDEDDEDEEE